MRSLHSISTRLVLIVFVSSFFSASAAVAQAGSFFPLDPGNNWTYQEDRFDGERDIEVLEAIEELRRVRFGSVEVLMEETPTGILIDRRDEEEFGTFYDFVADRFTHHDFFECDDGRLVTVTDREFIVETPAGIFEDCLRLEFSRGNCADAGTFVQILAPGVGLVSWTESSFAGLRTFDLVEFDIVKREPDPFELIRGDANADRGVDIADAVFTLSWLFWGGIQPTCLDAADTDDSGAVELTDPISLLNFLFLDGPPPALPGPFECGPDPIVDDLSDCSGPCTV